MAAHITHAITEALLNLIVFERVSWMFAFFPGSFRTKSKIYIVAGLDHDWLGSLKTDWNLSNRASLQQQQQNWTASNQQGYLIWIRVQLCEDVHLHLFTWNILSVWKQNSTCCLVKVTCIYNAGIFILFRDALLQQTAQHLWVKATRKRRQTCPTLLDEWQVAS